MPDISADAPGSPQSRYQVLAFLCLAAVIAYIQRAALSVPAKEISTDLKFTNLAQDMGWVQSAWFMSYAVMQLPCGWLADRIGSRRALALFCLLWSGVTLLSGLATSWFSLLVLWGMMGAAQAGAFPCAAKAIGQIFPDTERARASGMLSSGMLIGGAIASGLTGVLLNAFTPLSEEFHLFRWRLLFVVYAIPGVLWMIAFLVFVPAIRLPIARRPAETRLPFHWGRLLSHGVPFAILCSQQFFRAAGMVIFVTWFPTFLQQTRGVSSLKSGVLTTIAGVGGVLGSLCGGFVSDWILRRTGNSRLSRQGVAIFALSSCASLWTASVFVENIWGSIALVSLGVFCAAFGGVSGYTVAIKFGGQHVGRVFGAMNMCGNIGASLFPLTAGWLVAKTGNWNLPLFLAAGVMAMCAVCWVFLNPQGTLFGDEDEPG